MASEEPEQIKIKDYQIHLPPLGEGTFGTVYRATYRSLSDRALKVYRPGAVDIVTMARELEKLSKVAEHNGIVTLHDFDLLNEPPYYAMGLHADQADDNTWETRTLERMCGHVDYQEAWRLIREVADALSYLHRHQVVHCDIKPSNILLTDETPHHIKICDFGQSRGLSAEGFEPVGTPLYASPEQLRAPSDSADGKGFRWDVYSFGVVAYKLLTGDLPRLQSLAKAEKTNVDLEATIKETTIEETMADGNMLDGENLANMVEAVEEIQWPDNFYIPTARKLLIEQCLSLDPAKRPADMREVWSRIKERDHYRAVRRARRVAAVFALLLVFAIWATIFAFIQAGRAKSRDLEATVSGKQAEELALIIVNELNEGEFSGQGAEKLYSIIADHSETFLDNLPKNRRSETTLRFSAQTASMRGSQALKRGDFEEALSKYSNAYEIRTELGGRHLAILAFRDLMQIGRIHQENGDMEQAIESFEPAKEWRLEDFVSTREPTNRQLKEVTESFLELGNLYDKLDEPRKAIDTFDEIANVLSQASTEVSESQVTAFQMELLGILDRMGEIQKQDGELKDAYGTFTNLEEIAGQVRSTSPTVRESAKLFQLKSIHQIGLILLEQGQKEKAAKMFNNEIRLWEIAMELRSYDPNVKIGLADACHKLAECTDTENRSRAQFFLEKAQALISSLPSSIKNTEENIDRVVRYQSQLDVLLEKDES